MEKICSFKVLTKFEGAMIGDYVIEENNLFIKLKKEKPTFGYKNVKFDYNLHFNFGLINKSKKEKIIRIFLECKSEKELKNSLKWLWLSDDCNKEYKLSKNIFGKTNFHGKYFFKLKLKPEQVVYISNFPPKSYKKLEKEFTELSLKTKAKKVILGKTVQRKNIIAYEYGDLTSKPTLLFVSGFHPPERDTIAIEAIMEKFLNNQWKYKVLKNYSFSFIPILNPDGFANYMQGSNINEINFHWKFFGNSLSECPEAHNIWEYCTRIKPIIFFDFHAFTFQDNNPRPYLIPEGYYIPKKARLIQKFLNSELSKLCNNSYSKNEIILAPTLLATRLRDKIGTITIPKFHMHMKNGLEETKQMAIDCFDIIINGLNTYNINDSGEILKIPYGKIRPKIFDRIRINILNFWYFQLISIIKKVVNKVNK